MRWYRDMRRDLTQPLPETPELGGIEIRLYAAELSEHVRITHNQAFVPDHWGSNPADPEPWLLNMVGNNDFRPQWSFVAIDPSAAGPRQIAGYALSAAYEQEWPTLGFKQGWTDVIGVRREYRGRGVASALLIASMQAFREAGMDGAGLGVDSANPNGALGLYNKLGYTPARGFVLYAKELNET
jgi:ribosomal protein S18 acetylase RimI-like enzyme